MNDRQRFQAVMDYKSVDRLPVYWFGLWEETLARWQTEGWDPSVPLPQAVGLDPDWEIGMWESHNLVNHAVLPDCPDHVVEETEEHQVVRTGLGALLKVGKHGSSIPQHLEEALKPSRESWNRFRQYLDPDDPRRAVDDRETRIAELNQREAVVTCFGGSLFGFPRDWMGPVELSYLCYDDPALYEEIIEHMAHFFVKLHEPMLSRVRIDFLYFFEDCCFNTGPLFSPAVYRKFYHKYYRMMIDFYRSMGVKHILIDSDGKVDDLIPCWLESGFDILFPLEVGTWETNPAAFRQKYGRDLRMMGGVDKHVIPQGEQAIRSHLESLREVAADGGYIPIPDHRIPPNCSLDQFKTYVRVFREIFG